MPARLPTALLAGLLLVLLGCGGDRAVTSSATAGSASRPPGDTGGAATVGPFATPAAAGAAADRATGGPVTDEAAAGCGPAQALARAYGERAGFARGEATTAAVVAAWWRDGMGSTVASNVDLAALDPATPVSVCVFNGPFENAAPPGPPGGPDVTVDAIQFFVVGGTRPVLGGMGRRGGPMLDTFPGDPVTPPWPTHPASEPPPR